MPRSGWPSGVDAKRREPPHGRGHDALTAGLVHGARAGSATVTDRPASVHMDSRGEAPGRRRRRRVDDGAAGLVACGVAAAASARVSRPMRRSAARR